MNEDTAVMTDKAGQPDGQMDTETTLSTLKYDQTGEALQATGEQGEDGDIETGCSVLTPEQIFSQLSMVLHSGGNRVGAELEDREGDGEKDVATSSNGIPASSSARKPAKTKRARERKGRKCEQLKRTKEAEGGGIRRVKFEKRPRRRLRPRKGQLPADDPPPDFNSCPRPPILLTPKPHVHVVEISPDTNSPDLGLANSSVSVIVPCVTPAPASLLTETPCIHLPTPVSKASVSSAIVDTSTSTAANSLPVPCPTTTAFTTTNTELACPSDSSTLQAASNTAYVSSEGVSKPATANRVRFASSLHCNPLNFELLGRLIGEPVLTSFYRAFHRSRLSENLKIELLDPLGDSANLPNGGAESLPRWLQVTQKRMHIDPHLGPLTLARLLVSNGGIVKYQHLFPFTRTVYMRHVKSCDVNAMLSELSPRRVLCPGLPNYARNHVILGFHPEDVRILPIQTPNYQRYDHKKCPIFHSPSRRIPASERTYDENMCSKCTHLHTSILKLICHKYSRINSDLEKQLSSSPATSSNGSSSSHGLPSSSSVKDSSSSSRQNPASKEPSSVTSPVAAGTNSTVDIATYYKELSGGLVTTLSISPSTLPPSQENSHLVTTLPISPSTLPPSQDTLSQDNSETEDTH